MNHCVVPVEAMEKVCNVPTGSHVAPFGEEELLLSLTFGNHFAHASGLWLATPLQGELLGDALVYAFPNEVRRGGSQKLGGLLQHGVKGKSFRYLPGNRKAF